MKMKTNAAYSERWLKYIFRSLGSSPLVEPRVRVKHGEAPFSRDAAYRWNHLPDDLKCAPAIATVKSKILTAVGSLTAKWLRRIIAMYLSSPTFPVSLYTLNCTTKMKMPQKM